ncbi:sugar phosphate isomerase/epimerase family protein [Nocardia sp. NPDC003963]
MILWSGSLVGTLLQDRIKIAAAAGYSDLSVAPMDFGPPGTTEKRSVPLRQLADDLGIRLSCLDPVTAWLPGGAGTGRSVGRRSGDQHAVAATFDAYTLDECLGLAHSVGAQTISAVELSGCSRSFNELVDRLAFICGLTENIGARTQLEPMPFSAIKTPREALQIIQASGSHHTGIVFDTWHYARVGGLPEHLHSLPPGCFSSVQISDGPMIPAVDVWNESSTSRLPPGDGNFHLTDIMESVRSLCCDDVLACPEVVSTSYGISADVYAVKIHNLSLPYLELL